MEWTQEEGFNNNLLKPLIESGLNYNELTYEELPDDQKEIIDIQWEEYSKYSSMRCSEHCGQRNEG